MRAVGNVSVVLAEPGAPWTGPSRCPSTARTPTAVPWTTSAHDIVTWHRGTPRPTRPRPGPLAQEETLEHTFEKASTYGYYTYDYYTYDYYCTPHCDPDMTDPIIVW